MVLTHDSSELNALAVLADIAENYCALTIEHGAPSAALNRAMFNPIDAPVTLAAYRYISAVARRGDEVHRRSLINLGCDQVLKRGIDATAPRDVMVYVLGTMLSLSTHDALLSDPDVAHNVQRIVTEPLSSSSSSSSSSPTFTLDALGWTVMRQALGVLALVVRHCPGAVIRPLVHAGLIEKIVRIFDSAPERVRANAITAVAHFFIFHAVIVKERDLGSSSFRDSLLQGFAHNLYRISVAPETHPAVRESANSCAVLISQFFGAEDATQLRVDTSRSQVMPAYDESKTPSSTDSKGVPLGDLLSKRFCGCCNRGDAVVNLKPCAACRKVFYCSVECQKKDWALGHKRQCTASTTATKKTQ